MSVKTLLVMLIVALPLLAPGCGQKGPLSLPDPQTEPEQDDKDS